MSSTFADLGLSEELLRAVAEQGYTTPTPVQIQAIPAILAGRDVLAGAQTGTGKTAGFALPLLQRLETTPMVSTSRGVRALVLTPTRELAAQVEECFRAYGRHLRLRSTLIFGGVGFNPQAQALERGVDILVATPGRLLDHIAQRTVDLSRVEILVLDEADRMLDMGFIRDIRRILKVLPRRRQNLLFSATYADELRELAEGLLHEPTQVEVARRNADSDLVAQRVHPVDAKRKRALLSHLVASGDWRQVLVFTRTKHGANRLAEQLCRDGIQATAIHGNKSQNARTKALQEFKSGDVRVLVATDIAARGLDIELLPHVVNYDMPNVPEDYVHRIGRTGRAGSVGEAISLVSGEEREHLGNIEKLLRKRIDKAAVPGFEPGSPLTEAELAQAAAPQPAQHQHQQQHRPQGQNGGSRQGQRPQQRAGNHGRNRQQRGPGAQGGAQTGARPGNDAARPAADGNRRPVQGERQPSSHESQQFPSSGTVYGHGPSAGARRDRGAGGGRPSAPRGAFQRRD